MRVVFIGTRGFPGVQGGVEKHCEFLTTSLQKLGCEIIVFTRKPYINPTIVEYEGVKLIPLPSIRHKTFEAFLHTFIGIFCSLKYKPDIIHIQGIGPGVFALLGRILGQKIVLTTHGSNYEHLKWTPIEKLILKYFERIAILWSNEVIAISDPIATGIKNKYGRTPYIIPNGVKVIYPIHTEKKLNELSLIKRKYILAVGRIVPEKGFHDLVKAFTELKLKDWKLVIVGNADHISEYSLNLKKMAYNDLSIVFTGFLSGSPLIELFSNAGLFVLPSYYEGLPIALLEAMSFGLTCIASNISGNKNLGLLEENYFEVADVDGLKRKVSYFVQYPNSEDQSKAQIEQVRNSYNWNKIAMKTLEVYRKTILK